MRINRRGGKTFIWLDDERPNPDPNLWILFKNSPDLIAYLNDLIEFSPDLSNVIMSLDHDLGARDDSGGYVGGTGYDAVLWLEDQSVNLEGFVMPEVRIHSANPVGRAKMQAGLDSIKKRMLCE